MAKHSNTPLIATTATLLGLVLVLLACWHLSRPAVVVDGTTQTSALNFPTPLSARDMPRVAAQVKRAILSDTARLVPGAKDLLATWTGDTVKVELWPNPDGTIAMTFTIPIYGSRWVRWSDLTVMHGDDPDGAAGRRNEEVVSAVHEVIQRTWADATRGRK